MVAFNPEYVGKVDVTKHVMIGSVDFSKFTDSSGKNEMYEAFVNEMGLLGNESKRKYLIFDETNHTVWFCWCEGSLLR